MSKAFDEVAKQLFMLEMSKKKHPTDKQDLNIALKPENNAEIEKRKCC